MSAVPLVADPVDVGERTGMFLDDYLPEPALERTLMGYQTVIDARCPLRFVTQFTMDRSAIFPPSSSPPRSQATA
jgi:hypothetical protein